MYTLPLFLTNHKQRLNYFWHLIRDDGPVGCTRDTIRRLLGHVGVGSTIQLWSDVDLLLPSTLSIRTPRECEPIASSFKMTYTLVDTVEAISTGLWS